MSGNDSFDKPAVRKQGSQQSLIGLLSESFRREPKESSVSAA